MNDHPSVGKVIQTTLLKQDMADSPMQAPAASQLYAFFSFFSKPQNPKTWSEIL